MTTGKVVLFLLLLAFVGTATADTLYVNTTGWYRSGAAFNASATPIQHAVDNATSGDTVYVWNGSYTENVDIATAHLTIEGEGRDVVTVTAAVSTDHTIYTIGAYTNISGLTITGTTAVDMYGIFLSATHGNITANNITGNWHGVLSASEGAIIKNNIITSNIEDGLRIYYHGGQIITDNVISYNCYRGVRLDQSTNTVLTNNTAHNNSFAGFLLWGNSDHNTMTNNTAIDNRQGIFISGSDNNDINNCITTNNWLYGLTCYYANNNTVTNHSSSSNPHDYRAWSNANNNTLLDCNLNNATSLINDSTSSQWIIRYTTSNITDYSDTSMNQTISPTNVTTTIESTVDNYTITMDTLDDFSASTDVSTATFQLVEFASGGHSEFNVSSDQPATVTTFNLGTFTPGQVVQLKRNDLGVTCARAGAAGIATFIYSGGFSDHEFETDPVGLYVHLNDTENYTFTNDSYDAAAFTSQVTITSTGSPACAVSIEMPLITDSAYTKLGYTVTNVTGGYRVTNSSGWAAINFTVTENTTMEISPSATTKPGNLPAVVGVGIGAATVIIYLIRRRRR